MKFSKVILIVFIAAPLLAALSGCSSTLIGVREGSDRVSLADAKQVTACQSKGQTTVTVLAKVGFITRSVDDVEANLYQLARNNAVADGSDTLVKGESKEFGKRTYEMYKCRP